MACHFGVWKAKDRRYECHCRPAFSCVVFRDALAYVSVRVAVLNLPQAVWMRDWRCGGNWKGRGCADIGWPDQWTQNITSLKVNGKAVLHLRASCIVKIDLGVEHWYHTYFKDCSSKTLRKRVPWPELLQRVSHCARQELSSIYPSFKNVFTNIFYVSSAETVLDNEPSASGRNLMVNQEQESIALIENLMPRFLRRERRCLIIFTAINRHQNPVYVLTSIAVWLNVKKMV